MEAAPPSAPYRLKKLVRRNKGVVTAGALLAMALVVGGGDPADRRAEVMAVTCNYFFRRSELQRPPVDPADFAAAIATGERGTRPFSPVAALRVTCRASAGSTP